ncbi:hypothetical protein PC121_g17617 [Phytophthora cactorum]|nr:hypothetical protein PC121_g17617 [Phytophthora cactorum]
MVFAPRGMDPRVVEDAIKENFDFAEPAPFRIAAGAPPPSLSLVNRSGIRIFTETGLGELGPDSDGGSEDADSANSALIPMVDPRTPTRLTMDWALPTLVARH